MQKEYKIPIRQTGNFVSSEGSTVRVYVEEGRTLANSYGRGDGFNWFIVDSLIVGRLLHDDDFHTICEYGHGKKLSGLVCQMQFLRISCLFLIIVLIGIGLTYL